MRKELRDMASFSSSPPHCSRALPTQTPSSSPSSPQQLLLDAIKNNTLREALVGWRESGGSIMLANPCKITLIMRIVNQPLLPMSVGSGIQSDIQSGIQSQPLLTGLDDTESNATDYDDDSDAHHHQLAHRHRRRRQSDGRTPLHIAIDGRHLEAAKVLLEGMGADPSITDKKGRTALHAAAEKQCVTNEFIALLVAKASHNHYNHTDHYGQQQYTSSVGFVNALDGEGRTALHIAILFDNLDTAAYLVTHCKANTRHQHDNRGVGSGGGAGGGAGGGRGGACFHWKIGNCIKVVRPPFRLAIWCMGGCKMMDTDTNGSGDRITAGKNTPDAAVESDTATMDDYYSDSSITAEFILQYLLPLTSRGDRALINDRGETPIAAPLSLPSLSAPPPMPPSTLRSGAPSSSPMMMSTTALFDAVSLYCDAAAAAASLSHAVVSSSSATAPLPPSSTTDVRASDASRHEVSVRESDSQKQQGDEEEVCAEEVCGSGHIRFAKRRRVEKEKTAKPSRQTVALTTAAAATVAVEGKVVLQQKVMRMALRRRRLFEVITMLVNTFNADSTIAEPRSGMNVLHLLAGAKSHAANEWRRARLAGFHCDEHGAIMDESTIINSDSDEKEEGDEERLAILRLIRKQQQQQGDATLKGNQISSQLANTPDASGATPLVYALLKEEGRSFVAREHNEDKSTNTEEKRNAAAKRHFSSCCARVLVEEFGVDANAAMLRLAFFTNANHLFDVPHQKQLPPPSPSPNSNSHTHTLCRVSIFDIILNLIDNRLASVDARIPFSAKATSCGGDAMSGFPRERYHMFAGSTLLHLLLRRLCSGGAGGMLNSGVAQPSSVHHQRRSAFATAAATLVHGMEEHTSCSLHYPAAILSAINTLIVAHGARVDIPDAAIEGGGMTALHLASLSPMCTPPLLRLLLLGGVGGGEGGAKGGGENNTNWAENATVHSTVVNMRDAHGNTALHYLCSDCHHNDHLNLTARGGNGNGNDDNVPHNTLSPQQPPPLFAFTRERICTLWQCAAVLVKAFGADVTVANKHKRSTPLHLALERRYLITEDILDALLSSPPPRGHVAGEEDTVKDDDGEVQNTNRRRSGGNDDGAEDGAKIHHASPVQVHTRRRCHAVVNQQDCGGQTVLHKLFGMSHIIIVRFGDDGCDASDAELEGEEVNASNPPNEGAADSLRDYFTFRPKKHTAATAPKASSPIVGPTANKSLNEERTEDEDDYRNFAKCLLARALIVRFGADVNVQDEEGRSPLHFTALAAASDFFPIRFGSFGGGSDDGDGGDGRQNSGPTIVFELPPHRHAFLLTPSLLSLLVERGKGDVTLKPRERRRRRRCHADDEGGVNADDDWNPGHANTWRFLTPLQMLLFSQTFSSSDPLAPLELFCGAFGGDSNRIGESPYSRRMAQAGGDNGESLFFPLSKDEVGVASSFCYRREHVEDDEGGTSPSPFPLFFSPFPSLRDRTRHVERIASFMIRLCCDQYRKAEEEGWDREERSFGEGQRERFSRRSPPPFPPSLIPFFDMHHSGADWGTLLHLAVEMPFISQAFIRFLVVGDRDTTSCHGGVVDVDAVAKTDRSTALHRLLLVNLEGIEPEDHYEDEDDYGPRRDVVADDGNAGDGTPLRDDHSQREESGGDIAAVAKGTWQGRRLERFVSLLVRELGADLHSPKAIDFYNRTPLHTLVDGPYSSEASARTLIEVGSVSLTIKCDDHGASARGYLIDALARKQRRLEEDGDGDGDAEGRQVVVCGMSAPFIETYLRAEYVDSDVSDDDDDSDDE